jgi:hypothetical protein
MGRREVCERMQRQCAVVVNCKQILYNLDVMPTQLIGTSFFHKVPKDLQEVLKSNHDVFQLWNKLTPLARNEWVCWVTMVKKEETRQEHLKRFCEDLRKGKRRPCCWPGCPHRRPSAKKWFT